jgi:Tfp pilus assembly protein PilF
MSLLLQALQKAAKNRESGSGGPEETAPPPPSPASPSLEPATISPPAAILPAAFALDSSKEDHSGIREPELTLAEEDFFEADEPLPDETGQRFEPFGASPAASPADAAAILRAREAPSASWVDWLRDRPVWALGIGAGVFLVFYFIYVYLQIAHPGILRGEFMRQPLAPSTPPPAARAAPLPPKPASAQRDPLSTVPSKPNTLPSQGLPAPIPQPPTTGLPGTPSIKPLQSAQSPVPKLAPPVEPRSLAVTPAIPPAKQERVPAVTPVPQIVAAAPRTPEMQQSGERLANPEQAVRPTRAPRQRPRREPAGPVMSTPALEHEISSNSTEPGTATVAPVVKDAYQALQEGRLDKAENLYRNALQSEAKNVDALLGLGAISAQRGQVQQAIGFYEQALEIEPRNPTAQAGLISLIGQADPQMSETRLKQLIAREPSAFLQYSLGNLYASQNQWPAAQQAYFQAFQMQPDNADYAYNLAVGLEHLNQPKLALSYYRKAIELSFRKGRANFDQSRVIERIGQLSARYD